MIWNIIIIHLLGMMTPGPDFFYIVRTAAVHGRKNALCAAFGIIIGVMFWASATMLGLALLFQTFPALQVLLMCLGGSYLMYLGVKMLQVRQNAQFQEYRSAAPGSSSSILQEVKKGLFVNLSNPKIVIYFSSVMAAVLSEIQSFGQIMLVLLILLVETLAYFGAVAVLFSGQTIKRFYSRYSRWLDNAAGLFFLLFGAYLIYKALFT